jgi:hypothetical protein
MMPIPADPAPYIAIVCCQQGRRGHRSRALNVVIERAETVAIEFQQTRRIASRKVLPLQQDRGPALVYRGHKGLNKVVVLLPAHAIVLPANVDRVLQQLLVVRSRIEQDWQTMFRRNAAQRGVKRHLADGNAHTARALVAEAQDPLAIADHDAAHIVITRVSEDLIDSVSIGIADEESARTPPDFREALAALAHRRRIHHRQQFLGVVLDHGVEQRLIVVLQIAHVAVFAEGRVARVENALAPQTLILQRSDVGW